MNNDLGLEQQGQNGIAESPSFYFLDRRNIPEHVAIIMDGNGRWAEKRSLPRIEGHKEGLNAAKEVVQTALEVGIHYLTLYVFSIDNWKRPYYEIKALMEMFEDFLSKNEKELVERGIKLLTIGRRSDLPRGLQKQLLSICKKTESNFKLILTLALSYGSRLDIINGVKEIVKKALLGQIKISDIDEKLFKSHLSTSFSPDPDLLIRTSGEMRLSNFLLWESSYTEFYFTNTYWPDFRKKEFLEALCNFSKRQRRFGQIFAKN
ncbi:isoprenyl transferase [Methylacidiphilum caldifontis]|uniref:Isoprenyl transferase n=1 Tax=Methylacidiphilum caldifontis TaxID=2795386 RepID=A0A4Y8PE32_9BACT|nr:isoprenyl transferase [Methylacidiphilum caldifontis]QSR88043.1 isoprenyl transferase [Methylacidiphilum caldifontis]TFE69578.1 di-trans,poly-cis-decaprenylcistransferase [Methylacidiphilum caldifontis]